ncbi:MAG: LysR family transcriptional regulator [Oceanospirillaceae bacterium]|nr:LysR family transcriptional regulator [Oceanospirillaceae bacterium]
MNLRQLEAFRAVMLTGSATLAAKMIFISQPAVSRLLSDLEYTLGFKLFIRKPNKLVPTSEAHALFSEVERSFIGLSQIEIAAKAIKNHQQGCLRIVVTPIVVDSFMPDLLRNFLADHPQIKIELEVAPKIKASKLLRSNQIDFAILPLPNANEEGFVCQVFAQHAAVCVMPRDHPLAAKKQINITDLNRQQFLCLSVGSPFRTYIDGLFLQHNVEPKVMVETRHQHTIYELVKRGIGISILDPLVVDEADESIVVRAITPEINWQYALVHLEDRPLSLLGQAFSSELTKYFSSSNSTVPAS